MHQYQFCLTGADLPLVTLPEGAASDINAFFSETRKHGNGGQTRDVANVGLAKQECEMLARIVATARCCATLEIGLAVGSSAVSILAAKKALAIGGKHIALDPYQNDFFDIGILEIARRNLSEGFEFVAKHSEDYLAMAAREGSRFDFIFVDGAHTIGQKVTDAFFVERVLRPGGLVAFHDALLFSTAAAIRFLICERGFALIRLYPDSRVKSMVRRYRYLRRLGWWYCMGVVPHVFKSLALLRAPSAP